MNKRRVFVLLVAGAMSGPLLGQSENRAVPSSPVLKRAPSRAEWMIETHKDRQKAQSAFTKAGAIPVQGDAGEENKHPQSRTVSKDGTTYHLQDRSVDGRTTETWVEGDLQVYEIPSSDRIARAILPPFQYAESYSDFRRSDFEELEWINESNFKGVKDLGGRQVFEFRVEAAKRYLTPRERTELADPDANESAVDIREKHARQTAAAPEYVAYLEVKTQLPVYFDDGQVIRTYKFSTRPGGSLTIPQRFAAELDAWKKELQRRTPLPPP